MDVKNGFLSFTHRRGDKPTVIGLHPDLEEWITRQSVQDARQSMFSLASQTVPAPALMASPRLLSGSCRGPGVCGNVLMKRTPGGKGRMIQSLTFHSFHHGAATAVFKNAALKDIAGRGTAVWEDVLQLRREQTENEVVQ